MGENVFIKIIVVGEQNVGKTCILARYSRDQFDSTCPPTLGMDFQSKLLEYKGKTIRLQLWDIAGQERYNSVSKLYVRGAYGALVVADINQEASLQSSLKWKKMIEESCDLKDGQPIPMILVQNKVDDLKGLGQLQPFQTEEYLKEFAKENGFSGSLQVSAKDNTNIPDIFNLLIDHIDANGLLGNAIKPTESNYSKPVKATDGATQPLGSNTEGQKQSQPTSVPSQTPANQGIRISNNPPPAAAQKKGGCC